MKNKTNLIVVSVLLCVVVATYLVYKKINNNFDSSEWKNMYADFVISGEGVGAYGPLSKRKNMVKSLIKSEQLIGKNKEEVITVIGLENNDLNTDRWLYWLYFTAADNGWLEVAFNNEEVVEHVRLYED